MKKFKIGNIVFISLAILMCIISFIPVFMNGGEMRTMFIYLLVVSFAALVSALVLVILSKTKIMMIPMLVVFLNSFFCYDLLKSVLATLVDQTGAPKYGMDTFEFVMLVLVILGIVFTCLKQKWGAIVGIVGISYMIYAQNSLIYGFSMLKNESTQYFMIAWNAAAVLFQFVWLLLPMIFFLCEKPKKEETPQVQEQGEVK